MPSTPPANVSQSFAHFAHSLGKKEVDLNNPPDASASEEERNAYYDALAAQARSERNKNINTDEMVPQHAYV